MKLVVAVALALSGGWASALSPAPTEPVYSTAVAPAPAPAAAPAGPEFATRTTFDRIGRIVAPVMVNGQGPFKFMVDTGANHSLISTAIAERLGIDHKSAP